MRNKLHIFINQFKLKNVIYTLFISVVVILVSFRFYNFPFSLSSNVILENDGIFTQTQIQSLAQGAIFQRTDNLGYPFGYSQWTVPQFSTVESVFIWIISNVFHFSNFGLLISIGVFITFLNSSSFYILAKYYNLSLITKVLFIIVGAASPFALNSITHPHTMKIFIIPIYLVILKLILAKKSLNIKEYLVFSIFLLSSSLYWINVFFAIFIILLIVLFFNKFLKINNYNLEYFTILKLFIINAVLLLIHIVLFFLNRDITGENGRGKWHSDIFSGKLTDFLISSPFINHFIGRTQLLYEGASYEIKANMIGLPLIISFAYLMYLIISFDSDKSLEIKLIKQLSIIGLLFFLVGGLSNLQSAIFVFFDLISPMRTWSRVSILLSIIGLLLLFINLKKFIKLNRYISVFFTIFCLLDLIYLPKPLNTSDNWKTHEYYSVLEYIQQNLQPCPILQIPIDTYLVPQGALDNAWRYYWTDQIPYLVLPEFNWTAATYTDTEGWKQLIQIKSKLTEKDFNNLANQYCGILFDSNFSQYQIERKAALPNLNTGWPGLTIESNIKPDFEDNRFKVYIINEFKKY